MRGVLLDVLVVVTQGSTKPKVESGVVGGSEPPPPHEPSLRSFRSLLNAESRSRSARKLAKLLRDPDRFFTDARSPVVRRLGKLLRR